MGSGYKFICHSCGNTYRVLWGIGFEFPVVYKRIMDGIKDGKYGEAWKKLLAKKKYVAVDAEFYVFCCSRFKNWTVEPVFYVWLNCKSKKRGEGQCQKKY